jgi:threonine aldolase
MKTIDLRSDTVTQPTPEMRELMAAAPVGDDVYGDDPTANELEAFAAELLGKEASMFVPSGTFGNQVSIMTHTKRGDEVLLDGDAHIYWHEVGAAAALSGVQLRAFPVDGRGIDVGKLESLVRSDDIHEPPTGLICLENARGNGMVLSMDAMRGVKRLAEAHGIPVHMDGARLFNAAIALGVKPKEVAACADSVMVCLSKGLCAPVGSVVAGPRAFIARARKCRKLMGGGMRQVGILCAAGLYALRHMVDRLALDHANARYLAGRLGEIEGVRVDGDCLDINMVFFTLPETVITGERLTAELLKRGVKINGGPGSYRFVTNQGVDKQDIDTVVAAMKEILAKA